jgi:hypothetical protein
MAIGLFVSVQADIIVQHCLLVVIQAALQELVVTPAKVLGESAEIIQITAVMHFGVAAAELISTVMVTVRIAIVTQLQLSALPTTGLAARIQ